MAGNNHDNMAWYLYAYSGTRSFSKWKDSVTRLFAEFKDEMGSRSASELITKMVCYYCLEVGGMYKGEVAEAKFKRCNRWPDFHEAYKDKDHMLTIRWNKMRELDAKVQELRKELARRSVPPGDIQHEAKHRAARDILLAEIKRRHGDAFVGAADPFVRELISIYGPEPFIYMSLPESEDRKWKTLLSDREIIPNMLTSYFIERSLYDTFGSVRLTQMKTSAIDNVRSEVEEPMPRPVPTEKKIKPTPKKKREKVSERLSGRQASALPAHEVEAVFAFLKEHGSIRRKDFNEILGTDKYGTVSYFIKRLQERHPEIEKRGDSARTTHYALKDVA